MVIRLILLLLGMLCSFYALCDNHFVSPLVTQVDTARMGDYLFRYISFNTESEYPCLQYELLKPEQNYQVHAKHALCEFEGKSFKSGFSYVEFTHFNMEEHRFSFTLVTYELTSNGEYHRRCHTKMSKGQFSALKCSAPKRPF